MVLFYYSSKIELQCHWKFWKKKKNKKRKRQLLFYWRRFLFRTPALASCILSQCLRYSIYIQVDKGTICFISFSKKNDVNLFRTIYHKWFFAVDESRCKRYCVAPHFSTKQNILKKKINAAFINAIDLHNQNY